MSRVSRRVGNASLSAAGHVQHDQRARSNESFKPLPAPTGPAPYRLSLADVTADPADALVFHALGDSGGIVDAGPQEAVAAALAADQAASGARFLYHVGDVVYFNGDASQWFPQMYEPYQHYAAPIMGVPGNHDGDNSDDPGVPSLAAYARNMCGTAPVLTPEAGDVDRDCMTQPNVYWTLEAALVTVVGLYTNVPSGGVVEPDQAAWLAAELAAAPTDRPLIVALHHPPYSADSHHGGSASMGALIDNAAVKAGRWPNLVLAGHVHDYQRFTRQTTDGSYTPITYVVCGAGGYHNLHTVAADVGPLPWAAAPEVTLEAYEDKRWGFLRLTVASGKVSGEYVAVDRDGTVHPAADVFTTA